MELRRVKCSVKATRRKNVTPAGKSSEVTAREGGEREGGGGRRSGKSDRSIRRGEIVSDVEKKGLAAVSFSGEKLRGIELTENSRSARIEEELRGTGGEANGIVA